MPTGETFTYNSGAGLSQWISNHPEMAINTIVPSTIASKPRVLRGSKPPTNYNPNIPLIARKGFTFGCDPEGFLFLKKEGTPIPAAGMIPGTKWEPHKVDKGAVQVDGMAVEFNIDPASTYEEWEENITTVIKQLEKMLPKTVEIRWIPSVKFAPEVFDSAPDDAKELGCQPDFDAWDGGTNPTPRPEDPLVRCAGGHLHFGFTKDESLSDEQHILNCQDLGKQADWFLGGWSVDLDPDLVRRSMYGKMGAIRYKPYGVEYRVLSNFWVPHKNLRLEVWNRMVTAVESIGGYNVAERAHGNFIHMLRGYINNHEQYNDLMHVAEYPLLTLDSNRARI